ncbi:hypothetical protein ACP4OV_001346 [Aristida adscensionis]
MALSNIDIKLAQTTSTKTYELSINKLYLHHAWCQPSQTHLTILTPKGPQRLGETVANNWTIHDGPDPKTNAVVARAQGSHILCGDWHNSFTLVFEVDWLKGSTLLVMGLSVYEGQWGIVGGTGYFTMARGYINKTAKPFKDGLIKDPSSTTSPQTTPDDIKAVQPYRDGPKGGPGGQFKHEPKRQPHHLERFKINHGDCIVSFEFSYTDKDGATFTEGPWGGKRVWKFDEVKLGPTEFVKEVSGTVGQSEGYTVVTSLKFVTNIQTHGPYGNQKGTPFSLPEKKNGNVVGFFGSSGGLLDYLGVFVRP